MTEREALKLAREALENNRKTHYYCEDTWYSCPKHEDGCANESQGDECNCGADKKNAEIDKASAAIKEALAQPEERSFCPRCGKRLGQNDWDVHTCTPPQLEQEPLAWMSANRFDELRQGFTVMTTLTKKKAFEDDVAIYTTPPQRKPLTENEIKHFWYEACQTNLELTSQLIVHLTRNIEAAHGIKEQS